MRIRELVFAALANVALAAGASAAPVTVADLGQIVNNQTYNGALASGGIQWFTFTLSSLTYLDITTIGSAFDTEIGLYDSLGNLLGNDDDSGPGLISALSFGVGSGVSLGDIVGAGQDGAIVPGLFYLAIGAFNTTFAANFGVATTSQLSGAFQFNFLTDNVIDDAAPIPLPAALPLFIAGLAGLGFARRRKKIVA